MKVNKAPKICPFREYDEEWICQVTCFECNTEDFEHCSSYHKGLKICKKYGVDVDEKTV